MLFVCNRKNYYFFKMFRLVFGGSSYILKFDFKIVEQFFGMIGNLVDFVFCLVVFFQICVKGGKSYYWEYYFLFLFNC